MISIIICSVDNNLLARLRRNIEDTIGIPFEIISIDNAAGQYGICKAYNEGAGKAKYSILCFMHEDISISTRNWGPRVCSHLEDPRTGLLGIAGGDAKSMIPSSWSVPILSNEINLFQHYKYSNGSSGHIYSTAGRSTRARAKVLAMDGVWLCTRKDVFQRFRFDERRFTGFHGYDIDYSLQVSTQYDLFVVFDILIHHYSEGRPNRDWMKSAMIVSKKWKHILPLSVHDAPHEVYTRHHWQTMQVFLGKLSQLDYPYPKILYYLLFYSFNRFFRLRKFLSMFKYTLQCLYEKNVAPPVTPADLQ